MLLIHILSNFQVLDHSFVFGQNILGDVLSYYYFRELDLYTNKISSIFLTFAALKPAFSRVAQSCSHM
jgi:hypothetical protein